MTYSDHFYNELSIFNSINNPVISAPYPVFFIASFYVMRITGTVKLRKNNTPTVWHYYFAFKFCINL